MQFKLFMAKEKNVYTIFTIISVGIFYLRFYIIPG